MNHLIAFPYLICELVLEQCQEFKTQYDAFFGVPLCFNTNPKLFKGKHRNDIEGEQTASVVQEVVPPTFSGAVISYFLSDGMKEKIFRQLKTAINFKTTDIKRITTSRSIHSRSYVT